MRMPRARWAETRGTRGGQPWARARRGRGGVRACVEKPALSCAASREESGTLRGTERHGGRGGYAAGLARGVTACHGSSGAAEPGRRLSPQRGVQREGAWGSDCGALVRGGARGLAAARRSGARAVRLSLPIAPADLGFAGHSPGGRTGAPCQPPASVRRNCLCVTPSLGCFPSVG